MTSSSLGKSIPRFPLQKTEEEGVTGGDVRKFNSQESQTSPSFSVFAIEIVEV
jgi:hypothetical protein